MKISISISRLLFHKTSLPSIIKLCTELLWFFYVIACSMPSCLKYYWKRCRISKIIHRVFRCFIHTCYLGQRLGLLWLKTLNNPNCCQHHSLFSWFSGQWSNWLFEKLQLAHFHCLPNLRIYQIKAFSTYQLHSIGQAILFLFLKHYVQTWRCWTTNKVDLLVGLQ